MPNRGMSWHKSMRGDKQPRHGSAARLAQVVVSSACLRCIKHDLLLLLLHVGYQRGLARYALGCSGPCMPRLSSSGSSLCRQRPDPSAHVVMSCLALRRAKFTATKPVWAM